LSCAVLLLMDSLLGDGTCGLMAIPVAGIA
jgi:hypothetical protein